LTKETLLNKEQLLFQSQLDLTLPDQEAIVLAYACRLNKLGITDVKAIIGRGEREAYQVLDSLVTQTFLSVLEPRVRWCLSPHLQTLKIQNEQVEPHPSQYLTTEQGIPKPSDLGSAQVADKPSNLGSTQVKLLTDLTEIQRKILNFCVVPQKLVNIMEHLGLVHRRYFQTKHIKPLLETGILILTNPMSPNSPNQQYVTTETGTRLMDLNLTIDPTKKD
jgi:hypothetical protein